MRKTHGYGGEVKLAVTEGYERDVERAAFLFIGTSAAATLPYEIKHLRGADWIVALDGVDSKESAARLRGRTLYLKSEEVSDPQPQQFLDEASINDEYKRFVGFAMIDTQRGELGAIASVEAYPQQSMATVEVEGKPQLIPMNPDLITGIDFTKRIVFVKLPEGLLDL